VEFNRRAHGDAPAARLGLINPFVQPPDAGKTQLLPQRRHFLCQVPVFLRRPGIGKLGQQLLRSLAESRRRVKHLLVLPQANPESIRRAADHLSWGVICARTISRKFQVVLPIAIRIPNNSTVRAENDAYLMRLVSS